MSIGGFWPTNFWLITILIPVIRSGSSGFFVLLGNSLLYFYYLQFISRLIIIELCGVLACLALPLLGSR
jgi:hypothetical protein